ncbi:MAG: thiamine pyrophosphate protein domain protein TPP-binding protein [Deltaproteobacteria bacterium]|nr:thiamine pyrophosphate protein domain protein TPP-binding protein [Deltaproteobacteria bacterium]
MPRMTGGEAVIEALKREGVEYLFSIPGVQIMGVYDALYGEKNLRLVVVRHEQTALYMADGYARVTGKPGVGLVVPGPGVQNALAAVGTAYACSSPVLLLAGQIETKDMGKDGGALHEVNDQLDMVRPVTKWCKRVMRVEEIPGAIREAMRQMDTGRPRPTEVEIPWDTMRSNGEVEFSLPEISPAENPDREDIRRAAELLAKAQKPLIWAGGGAIVSDCSSEMKDLAEALGAPVATTAQGKGVIPENHPLSLCGAYYGFGPVCWAMPEADVVLTVGTRITWQQARPATALRPPQKLIQVDADPSMIGMNYPAEVAIVADARAALKALAGEVRKMKLSQGRWGLSELGVYRENHRKWLQQKAPLQFQIIQTLRKELADDAIFVCGVTNIGYWANLAYEVRKPRTFITSSYFATLGYSFPTALGAKIAAPDRQVVCVVGDGGFLYACSELATAVKYGINLVTIVFNDQAYGSTKSDQMVNFQGRVVGTEVINPDFVKLAESFGVKGLKATPEQLGKVLREALGIRQPVVIEVSLPTMIAPFQIFE